MDRRKFIKGALTIAPVSALAVVLPAATPKMMVGSKDFIDEMNKAIWSKGTGDPTVGLAKMVDDAVSTGFGAAQVKQEGEFIYVDPYKDIRVRNIKSQSGERYNWKSKEVEHG